MKVGIASVALGMPLDETDVDAVDMLAQFLRKRLESNTESEAVRNGAAASYYFEKWHRLVL